MATDKKPVTPEEIRQARNAYARAYRAANREHMKQVNKAWRERNKERVKAYEQKHWQKVAEKMRGDDSGT